MLILPEPLRPPTKMGRGRSPRPRCKAVVACFALETSQLTVDIVVGIFVQAAFVGLPGLEAASMQLLGVQSNFAVLIPTRQISMNFVCENPVLSDN